MTVVIIFVHELVSRFGVACKASWNLLINTPPILNELLFPPREANAWYVSGTWIVTMKCHDVGSCFLQTMYTDGLLTLHYGKHPATLAAEVGAWYSGDRHVDVTLACDDGSVVKAHRVVLAAASPLLASLLRNPALDHVVHLSGVRKTQLNHLLEFLYNGEALIPVLWIFVEYLTEYTKSSFCR